MTIPAHRPVNTMQGHDEVVLAQLMITYEWSDWRAMQIWWIQSVYVKPAFRRQGLFRALYQHAKAESTARGACGLRLYADTGNEKAMATVCLLNCSAVYSWLSCGPHRGWACAARLPRACCADDCHTRKPALLPRAWQLWHIMAPVRCLGHRGTSHSLKRVTVHSTGDGFTLQSLRRPQHRLLSCSTVVPSCCERRHNLIQHIDSVQLGVSAVAHDVSESMANIKFECEQEANRAMQRRCRRYRPVCI